MRALVTGDVGFVGRHVAETLRERGWEVHGLDRARGPDEDLLTALPHVDGPYDLVVHCAAVIGGRTVIDGSPLAVAENAAIDWALFRWATRVRPGRVVYLSSSAAYPTPLQDARMPLQLREDHIVLSRPWAPDASYGWCKINGEKFAQWAREAGVRVTVVRPFSGYGTDQAPDYPFRAFLDRAVAKADPFDVWGDGEQVRDFIHISDFVAAMLAAAERGLDGPVNLCSGAPTSFLQLARLFTNAARYSPRIRTHPDKPTGTRYRVGDPDTMREFYRPKVPLDQGVGLALSARGVPQPGASMMFARRP
jgi:nucleoside-diphosphate-sugar epimerase